MTAADVGFSSSATDSVDFTTLGGHLDLIVLDLHMPGKDGVELIRDLALSRRGTAVFLVSGLGQRMLDTAAELAVAHGLRYMGAMRKPFAYEDLFESLLTVKGELSRPPPSPSSASDYIDVSELESAIERLEIEAAFQPIVSVATGQVVAAECLARWRHPKRGLLVPGRFIPLAERYGLISEVNWAVLSSAVGYLQASDPKRVVPLSVNFSAHDFTELELPDRLAGMLDSAGVQNELINIELTESSMIHDMPRTLDTMIRLRIKGVGLWLDDFGTGYSSMEQLRRLPISAMKLDISFMPKDSNWAASLALFQGLVDMARNVNLPMIAEGVETPRQLEMLRELGCERAQGYLFGRPMPPDVFRQWLDSRL